MPNRPSGTVLQGLFCQGFKEKDILGKGGVFFPLVFQLKVEETKMNDKQYHDYELRLHHAKVQEAENASLADRQDARSDYAELLTSPDHLAYVSRLLLSGCYGYASSYLTSQIVNNRRMNRIAAIAQLLALYECGCPSRFAAIAYNSLNADQQTTANRIIQQAITEHLADSAD